MTELNGMFIGMCMNQSFSLAVKMLELDHIQKENFFSKYREFYKEVLKTNLELSEETLGTTQPIAETTVKQGDTYPKQEIDLIKPKTNGDTEWKKCSCGQSCTKGFNKTYPDQFYCGKCKVVIGGD